MSIDPQRFDDEELKRELAAAMGEVGAEALEKAASAPPGGGPRTDGRGRIRGQIVSVRGGDVFVDIGGKSEAFISLEEFDSQHPPVPGELHTFIAQGFDRDSGLMRLSLREAKIEADWASLKVGDVVEARVTGTNIGGLELQVGGVRGFMPKSQVDIARHEHFNQFVNHKLECEITEIDRRGKTVLLSRRRVLERQREQARAQIRAELAVGQTRRGVVQRLADYGAFIDIGGIDGLLHVSDMSYGRVAHPKDILQVGQEVEVQILKIDPEKDRISLGLKQLQTDPWTLAPGKYHIGDVVEGRVARLATFGAFIELEKGIEGLLPVSELSWTKRVAHPQDVLKVGDALRVKILEIDAGKRRLALSLKALGEDPWRTVAERYTPDAIVSGAVTRTTEFGAFIQLEEGVEGLAHISELSDRRVKTVNEVCKMGDVVQCRVLKVDPKERRISLSLKLAKAEAPGHDAHHHEDATATPAAPAAPKKERKKPLRGGLTW